MKDLMKNWKKAIEPKIPRAPTPADHQREAEAIIADIPRRIEEAARKAETYVTLKNGWVWFHDVAGGDEDKGKVDHLYERLRRENRPLRHTDLKGTMRIVIEWCEENGLECFLESQRIPMNDDEYNYCARPK